MSYVLTIKRAAGKPPLTSQDIERLVTEDGSLAGGGTEPIIWTSPTGKRQRYINADADHLWTDDVKGDDESQVLEFLDKFRSIARRLDARVFGEEGEDISDASEQIPAAPLSFRNGVLAMLLLVGSLLIMPFLLFWLFIRIFWHFLVKIPFLERFR